MELNLSLDAVSAIATDPSTTDQNLCLRITLQHCERMSCQISKLASQSITFPKEGCCWTPTVLAQLWGECTFIHKELIQEKPTISFPELKYLWKMKRKLNKISNNIKVTERQEWLLCLFYVQMSTKNNWLEIVILKILFSFCLCSYCFSLGLVVTILNNKIAMDLGDLGFRQRDSKGSLGGSSSLLFSTIED